MWKLFDRNIPQKSKYKSKFSTVYGTAEENIIRFVSRPSKNKKNVAKKDSKETFQATMKAN